MKCYHQIPIHCQFFARGKRWIKLGRYAMDVYGKQEKFRDNESVKPV